MRPIVSYCLYAGSMLGYYSTFTLGLGPHFGHATPMLHQCHCPCYACAHARARMHVCMRAATLRFCLHAANADSQLA